MNDNHLHVKLPSGAIANVSPECPNETLNTLDKMAELVIKAANEGTLKDDSDFDPDEWADSFRAKQKPELPPGAYIGEDGRPRIDNLTLPEPTPTTKTSDE